MKPLAASTPLQLVTDFWRRATTPLVPIPDVAARRTLISQTSMLLAGALIFGIQLLVRLLGLFDPTPHAIFGLGMALIFNLVSYGLARYNRMSPILAMYTASALIHLFVALIRPTVNEVLFYPSLLVLYSMIHLPRAHAFSIFVINAVGIALTPLWVPSLAAKIADPLTFYVILSLFIFVYMHHAQLQSRAQDADRRAREEERLHMALQAERHKLVERFVQAFSHYFRNQLSVIEANRYVIPRMAHDPERLQGRVDRIGESVTQMRDQLDNLRLMVSIDPSRAAPCDVDAVLSQLAGDHQSAAAQRKLTLHTEVAAKPASIWVDADHLKSALRQLLSNAISHTGEGGRITLRAISGTSDVQIMVADTGRGIDANRQNEIFDFFYKGDTAMSIDQGGVGIGLSIVKLVADVYGGTVQVQSAPGQGSTFTLTFPAWGGTNAPSPLYADATATPMPMPAGGRS
jgi:signal transduction histidine kinase